MFRAAAIVFVLTVAAFSQVTSNTAAQRAARIIPGLPTPPAATHWLTTPPIVVDCLITQRVAITVVETVVSQECLRVVFHKQGRWRTNDSLIGEPVIISNTTNSFSLSNAPTIK
jgi:hypothetical protein